MPKTSFVETMEGLSSEWNQKQEIKRSNNFDMEELECPGMFCY